MRNKNIIEFINLYVLLPIYCTIMCVCLYLIETYEDIRYGKIIEI